MAEVFLRRLSRWQADQQREAVADLYVEAYREAEDEAFHDRIEFLTHLSEHVQRPGFEMVIASTTGLVAGSVYGFRADRTGECWQGFEGALPPETAELTSAGRVFVMAELMVRPSFRRSTVATRLQETLLNRADSGLAMVVIGQENAAARAALHSWSWENLGKISPASGGPPRDAWTRRIPR